MSDVSDTSSWLWNIYQRKKEFQWVDHKKKMSDLKDCWELVAPALVTTQEHFGACDVCISRETGGGTEQKWVEGTKSSKERSKGSGGKSSTTGGGGKASARHSSSRSSTWLGGVAGAASAGVARGTAVAIASVTDGATQCVLVDQPHHSSQRAILWLLAVALVLWTIVCCCGGCLVEKCRRRLTEGAATSSEDGSKKEEGKDAQTQCNRPSQDPHEIAMMTIESIRVELKTKYRGDTQGRKDDLVEKLRWFRVRDQDS